MQPKNRHNKKEDEVDAFASNYTLECTLQYEMSLTSKPIQSKTAAAAAAVSVATAAAIGQREKRPPRSQFDEPVCGPANLFISWNKKQRTNRLNK